ncbi:LysR family transcriptional regulator [Phyllobacterium calauticae]|uniref:LysR family transcriptional regulator n=1 Tax=Phyllobacterium calauticae TaxID=2817027 RepID=UPI001CC06FDE|nr:LysR family transcriptional regulator [Phyllobacterium calauticae]MBZ3692874.1 LysR family transcriptional regulator [Phyllobacterium calauticae]
MKRNFTVRQGALDGVEAFLSVAQHRNFRKAAADLAVTPSAISQAVRTLESRLGAALFIRTTRSVGLTEVGERFLSRAKPAFEELVAASEIARDLGRRPAGLLRLAAPRAVVPILLEPLIASFCQAYPDVEVEIATGAELVDIAAEGFDAGIRLGQFIQADMIAVQLTPSLPLAVVGSPDYLYRRGRPERIDDLRHQACIRMRRSNGSIAPWSFVSGNEPVDVMVSGPFIANDMPTVLGAAVEGLGLAQVPGPVASSAVKAGKLIGVLEPFAPMMPGVYLYYPSRHQMLPKLRAFIDHVKSRPGAGNKPQ